MKTPFTTDYAEDCLPERQPIIQTTGVTRLKLLAEFAISSADYRTMGVVTASAGCGKTIAAQNLVNEDDVLTHTGLPSIIKIKVLPDSTSKALAAVILAGLSEKPMGPNKYELAEEVAVALDRNDVRLLVVDEADRLNEASFDLLRHIHDKSGRPILMVGLPDILTVIERQEKFRSRVGLRLVFPKVTEEEMLSVVLPQMVFTHWKYDSAEAADRDMGLQIYRRVGSSLRQLRQVLNVADMMTRDREQERISLAILLEAFTWTLSNNGSTECEKTRGVRYETGMHEQLSEARHEAKHNTTSTQSR
jgi:DNA transposition AAA+ family ATPase